MDIEGGNYTSVMGSDLERDGMFLEMLDAANTHVAEVFYSDVTNKMVVAMQGHALPIEAVEELLSLARLRLPPKKKVSPEPAP